MKKIFLILLAGILFSACINKQPNFSQYDDGQQIKMQVGSSPWLNVELALSNEAQRQGLSDRDEIGADGMLFVFPSLGQTSFWMKDMKFDLDMIWIAQGKVVDIDQNVPKPAEGASLSELPSYSPSQPVDMILELPAGKVADWQIEIGDRINFR